VSLASDQGPLSLAMKCFSLAHGLPESPAGSATADTQAEDTSAADELMKKLPRGGQEDFSHLLLAAVQMVRSGGADKASAPIEQQSERATITGEGPPATLDEDVQLGADADGSSNAPASTKIASPADSVELTRQKRREDARVARLHGR